MNIKLHHLIHHHCTAHLSSFIVIRHVSSTQLPLLWISFYMVVGRLITYYSEELDYTYSSLLPTFITT